MLLIGLLVVLQAAGSPAAAQESDAPKAHGWDDFPVFLWREKYAGKPPPEELVAPFGGVILMRQEDSTWARERGLSYLIWNVAGRDALHLDANDAWNARVERWIETHDEKLLVREPCLNDPKTIEGLNATLDATLAKHGAHPGLGLVFGDEVSLTPNGSPFDLCRCERCEQEWRSYATKNGWPERAPLTDEVLRALEQGDTGSLGAWMARRRFDQDRMIAVLEGLLSRADPAQEDPMRRERGLGLLGCTGQTPFGGVALERIATRLNFIECYAVGDARPLMESMPTMWRHRDELTTGPDYRPHSLETVFLEGESGADLAWQVWSCWLRGGSGLVLWNDRGLENLAPDARDRLAATVRAVRAVQEQTSFEMWPAPSWGARGIALIHDADSEAVGFLRDAEQDGATWPRRKPSYQREHGTRGPKVEAWIRLVEDAHGRIGSLPLSTHSNDCRWCPFRVLVAVELLVVDEADLAWLEHHVSGGGLLVIDGRFGWVDRRGRLRTDDALERLRRAGPGRVILAPELVESYLAERSNPRARERALEFLRDLAARHGDLAGRPWPLTPFEIPGPALTGSVADIPWFFNSFGFNGFKTGSMVFKTTRCCVWLPAWTTKAERDEHLVDLPLTVNPPEGSTLRWLWPPEGGTLRAGDAAVFLLESEEKSAEPPAVR